MAEPKRPKDFCKDCWTSRPFAPKRKAPHPGPRCATCHRAAVKARKAAVAERRDAAVYGLAAGGYDELLRIQGGACFICRRANGRTRRLSVDHDHATGLVRGAICRPCNTLLGHARDDVDFFRRAIYYLERPPASMLDPRFLLPKGDVDG